jgi:hypothetical protein
MAGTRAKAEPKLDVAAVAERFRGQVYRYILRLVSDASQAEDLTQETFGRHASFSGWSGMARGAKQHDLGRVAYPLR